MKSIVGQKFGESTVSEAKKIEACDHKECGTIYKIAFVTSYGEKSHINNLLLIPENWNGIFVGIGNGGIAGTLGTAWYSFAECGYAVAQSDLGTSALRRGEVTVADEGLWADYSHRAIHGMTVGAKEIIRIITGKSPDYSYFFGASAGGLSGLSEAQRHPSDYDGIVAGVPSNNGLAFVAFLLFCYRMLGGDAGYPLIGEELSKRINECAVRFFKARGCCECDEDDFIAYPWCGENTIDEFLDFLTKEIPSLTSEQIEALGAVYRGPKNPRTGEQIFCGMPIGSEVNTGYFLGDGITEDFDLPWFKIFFGEGFENKKFDFDSHFEKINNKIGKVFSANDPDLSKFEGHGGKLIVYSGAADPFGPFADHLNYYRRVCEKMGGIERVSCFFKYFILPGKGHSNDGRGVNMFKSDDSAADMIEVIRNWRENAIAPDTLDVAHKISCERDGYKFKRKVNPITKLPREGIDYPTCTSERLL